jgi:hypothetical protein
LRCKLEARLAGHVSAAGAKAGGEAHGFGRSRGDYYTTIHLKTDSDGHPITFEITGGEKAEAPMFEILLRLGPDAAPRAVVADKGYDSRAKRAAARACGAVPVIPYKANAVAPARRVRPRYLPRSRPDRAGRREAQTLQAHCPALRQDEDQARVLRRPR